MNSYDVGDVVVVTGTFSIAGVNTNPTALTLWVKKGDDSVVHYVNGTDSQVTNPSTGVFLGTLNIDVAGYWAYRFVGTGAAQATEEGEFFVRTPQVPTS